MDNCQLIKQYTLGSRTDYTKGIMYPDKRLTLTAAQANSLEIWPGGTVAANYPNNENPDGSFDVRGEINDFGGGEVFLDEYWYDWGPGSGFTGPSETFVEETSWIRMRELSLGYNFASMFNDGLFSNFSLTFTGRNLGLWTDYSGVDPDTNLTGATNGFGLDYFNKFEYPQFQNFIYSFTNAMLFLALRFENCLNIVD